jgi:serine/threonine protein kinase
MNDCINPNDPQIQALILKSASKITKQCDIYSIGAILYQMLLGEVPSPDCAKRIMEEKLEEESPDNDVYQVPFFLKGKIVSD